MSWRNLRTTFSQITNSNSKTTPTPKRRLPFFKTQSQSTNFPVLKAKRRRIGAPLTEAPKPSNDGADSDASIEYDPDYDDYCNGCYHHPSKAILPVVTCKSPCSRTTDFDPSQRSPLRERNTDNRLENTQTRRLSLTRQKETTTINWNTLEQSFRETESEKHILEKSIATGSDSDDSENDENVSQLIQNTQSSEGSRKDPCSPRTCTASAHQPVRSPGKTGANLHNATTFSYRRQSSPQKKVQCRKGGYVEKLRKVVNRHKSDYAFWYHAQRSQMHPSGVRARVKEQTESYGRQMLTVEDERGKDITIFPSESDKLSVGDEVRIDLDATCCNSVDGKCFYLGFNKVMKM